MLSTRLHLNSVIMNRGSGRSLGSFEQSYARLISTALFLGFWSSVLLRYVAMLTDQCLETSGSLNPSTQCNIPEDQNPQRSALLEVGEQRTEKFVRIVSFGLHNQSTFVILLPTQMIWLWMHCTLVCTYVL
jgi:hypothetical protein